MTLQPYKSKRNFSQTPEPPGKPGTGSRRAGLQFVVHKHAARRLHYDLRLEMNGVLKSWAVPKGVPTQPGVRRLAIAVEDHPLAYGKFEGTIPAGEYGAGTVMVWDRGTYEVAKGPPLTAWRQGKLTVHLHGHKLNGEWTLVRLRGDENRWLVMKHGPAAPSIPAGRDDESVASQRSMKEIAIGLAGVDKTELADSPRQPPGFVEPMKARLVEELPVGTDWSYEVKLDGYRVLAVRRGRQVALWSRTEHRFDKRFPDIARVVTTCRCRSAVLDGEVVALDEAGRFSFQLLQNNQRDGALLAYYVFDILNYEGRDVRHLPWCERRALVQRCLAGTTEPLRFSASLEGHPPGLVRAAKRLGLEGLVAKQRQSRYESGRRSGAWVKCKFVNEQEFVIGGYTAPRGSRSHFGALIVGYYAGRSLRFAGKVGTGFDDRQLRDLWGKFQPLHRRDCPFAAIPRAQGRDGGLTAAELRTCVWLQPKLVCEVRFADWTRVGSLRQPVYLGLRADKRPREVIRERNSA